LIKNELRETKEMNVRIDDENRLMSELFKISKIDY
jgi:hypothetical protein